jgi:hypothetical protein
MEPNDLITMEYFVQWHRWPGVASRPARSTAASNFGHRGAFANRGRRQKAAIGLDRLIKTVITLSHCSVSRFRSGVFRPEALAMQGQTRLPTGAVRYCANSTTSGSTSDSVAHRLDQLCSPPHAQQRIIDALIGMARKVAGSTSTPVDT